ncbi:MAG: 23S rRNA (guanosine(2251)-2'-O)-methyltransferase RlmB [Acidimicrobiales bacterium]
MSSSSARKPGPLRRPSGLGGEQVEGCHAVHGLLALGRRPVERIWLARSSDPPDPSGRRPADGPRKPLDGIVALARERGVAVQMKDSAAIVAAARTSAPQGVIAWARPVRAVPLEQLLAPSGGAAPTFLLVLDQVTDPGNFGALLRSAACAGAGGVVVSRHRSAPLTPAAVKAAAGAVEVVPIAQVASVAAALAEVKASGTWAVGLDPSGDEELWRAPALDGAVALVLGAEGGGLSRLVRRRCDTLVRVPQAGMLGSLNVAAAGAVACFEVARRRVRATVAGAPF